MVQEGGVLGLVIPDRCIEVDKVKIEVINRLPHPTSIKGVQSFLGHVEFYRRFVKDFSKIGNPLTQQLAKDALFAFTNECYKV